MKRFTYTFFCLTLCLSFVYAQQNRLYDTTFTVVTLSSPQSFYLDSRIVSQISGRSRLTLPITLPQGSLSWYYSFSAMEAKNEPMEWVSLASQLTKLVDKSGISAVIISRFVQPTGTASCDIYVLNTEGVSQFEQKNDDKWQYDRNTSRQNMTGGIVQSAVSNRQFSIGLSNPSLKSGINVRIEISAVVGKLAPIYNQNRHSNDSSSEHLWSNKEREILFQRFQSSFQGKLTPSVTEVSTCILAKTMKHFTPQEFNLKALGEQEVLIAIMKKDCYSETHNEALENSVMELESMKLKINELEQKGDFTTMASLAERIDLEFPSNMIQSRHLRALLLSNQLSKAQTLGEILAKKNPEDLIIQANLAHVYLLSNQYKQAENQYIKFKQHQNTEGVTWEELIADDFNFFIRNHIFSSSYDNIKKKLKIKT